MVIKHIHSIQREKSHINVFWNSSNTLEISLLSDVGLVKILSHSISWCFVLFTGVFTLLKLFSFMRSHLSIVDLGAFAFGVLIRKLSPVPVFKAIPSFFPNRFSVFDFKTLLDKNFVQSDRYGSIFNFLHADT